MVPVATRIGGVVEVPGVVVDQYSPVHVSWHPPDPSGSGGCQYGKLPHVTGSSRVLSRRELLRGAGIVSVDEIRLRVNQIEQAFRILSASLDLINQSGEESQRRSMRRRRKQPSRRPPVSIHVRSRLVPSQGNEGPTPGGSECWLSFISCQPVRLKAGWPAQFFVHGRCRCTATEFSGHCCGAEVPRTPRR